MEVDINNRNFLGELLVKPVRHISISSVVIACLLLPMMLSGCMRYGLKVVPVPSHDVLELYPNEVVTIMQRVGFTDEQIKDYAWSVREALARSGAVRILVNSKAVAGFAIQGDEVLISSSRGNFIYNINTGWVGEQMGY